MANDYYSPTDLTKFTLARSGEVNAQFAAIEAGFDALPTETRLKTGTVNYAVTTGSANTYAASLPHAPSSYSDGLGAVLKIHVANTGASTLDLGLGATDLKRNDGSALESGDLPLGAFVEVRHNGTHFRLVGVAPGSQTAAEAAAQAAAASASAASSSASAAASSASAASNSATSAANQVTLAAAQVALAEDQVDLAAAEVVNAQTEVTNAAAQVTLATAQANAAAASAALISGWGYENVWSSATTYDENNIVYHDGYSYISLQDSNLNQTPAFNAGAGTAYWGVMAAKGDTGSPGAGTGDMLGANNLTDVVSVSTAFANIKQAATTTASGVLEIATDAEAQAKTDTGRALVPSNLAALGASDSFAGLVELATSAETITGTDTARAVTPAGLAALTASDTRDGLVEIATDAEAIAKTDTGRALVPSNLAALGASTTFAGLAELATDAEAQAKTDTARTLTPSNLAALGGTDSFAGLLELATTAEVVTGTDTARAVTAAGVQAALHGGTVTRTAAVDMSDQQLQQAYIKDFSMLVVAKGNLGATPAFDYSAGNVQTGTLSANATATVSNWPATGRYGKLELIITQDAASAYTVTWPAAVVWSDGVAPDLSTLSSVTHIVLTTHDAGTTIRGFRAGGEFA